MQVNHGLKNNSKRQDGRAIGTDQEEVFFLVLFVNDKLRLFCMTVHICAVGFICFCSYLCRYQCLMYFCVVVVFFLGSGGVCVCGGGGR